MNARNAAFALSVLWVMGCAEDRYGGATSPGGTPAANAPNTGSATAVPEYSGGAGSESDGALVARIQQAFNDGSLGFSPNVNVSAKDGVVYLMGTVPDESSRLAVDNLVRNTSGVVSVQDRMQVASLPSQIPPSGYVTNTTGDIFSLHIQSLNETDEALARRVMDNLRTDTTLATILPSVNINIVNGTVALQGTVQNDRQRRAIGEAVQRGAGVQNVVDNQLSISP